MLLNDFKTFFNGKKIPCIPPLLYENKFVIDFYVNSEILLTIVVFFKMKVENPSALNTY